MIACGARGLISTTSNLFPKQVSDVCRLALAGDWREARRAHLALVPVYEAMFVEANPGPLKFALSQTGRTSAAVRLPLVTPGEASRSKISDAVRRARGAREIALHGATGRMGKEIIRLVHENRKRGDQIVGAIAVS
jgi:4-hydroxy-tetrahydrodipicolinate synthase